MYLLLGAGRLHGLEVQRQDPVAIGRAGMILRDQKPLEPFDGTRMHVDTGNQHVAKQRLRGHMPLLGCRIEPAHRERGIARDTIAVELHARKLVLGVGVAEIGATEATKSAKRSP